jgi:hypothetical protein
MNQSKITQVSYMLTRLTGKMLMWSPVLKLTGPYTLRLTLPLLFRQFFFFYIIPLFVFFAIIHTNRLILCTTHGVVISHYAVL